MRVSDGWVVGRNLIVGAGRLMRHAVAMEDLRARYVQLLGQEKGEQEFDRAVQDARRSPVDSWTFVRHRLMQLRRPPMCDHDERFFDDRGVCLVCGLERACDLWDRLQERLENQP